MSNVGPNIKRLAAMKFSKDAIPDGGGLQDGIEALLDKRLGERMLECIKWAQEAVEAVRLGGDPNRWKNASDEDIAGEIVKQAEAKRGNTYQSRRLPR